MAQIGRADCGVTAAGLASKILLISISIQIRETAMPEWLQIAAAVAGAILSYYGRYDDTNVKEMIKDVAYNVGLALQRLNEISLQIADLQNKLEQLPDKFKEILYAAELTNLNDTILAASLRYKQLIGNPPPRKEFAKQLHLIYDDVIKHRTNLPS